MNVQVLVFLPPLEQAPDQMAFRLAETESVRLVPILKYALEETLLVTARIPGGLEETDSLLRPVADTVLWRRRRPSYGECSLFSDSTRGGRSGHCSSRRNRIGLNGEIRRVRPRADRDAGWNTHGQAVARALP